MKRFRYSDDDEDEEERPTHRLMIRTRNNDEIVYPSSPQSQDSIDRLITAMYDEIHGQDRDRALQSPFDMQAWLRAAEENEDMRVHALYARQFYESEDELWDGIYAPTPVPQNRDWRSQSSDELQTGYWYSQGSDQVFVPIPGVRALYPQSDTEDETLPNQVVDDQDVIDNFPNAYDPTQVVTQDDDATASQTGDALDIAREYIRRAFEE